jgi:hypothetical protein
MRSSFLSAFQSEKRLEKIKALVFEHAARGDFEAMVDAWQVVQVGGAAEAAHLGIAHGVANAFEPRHERGT